MAGGRPLPAPPPARAWPTGSLGRVEAVPARPAARKDRSWQPARLWPRRFLARRQAVGGSTRCVPCRRRPLIAWKRAPTRCIPWSIRRFPLPGRWRTASFRGLVNGASANFLRRAVGTDGCGCSPIRWLRPSIRQWWLAQLQSPIATIGSDRGRRQRGSPTGLAGQCPAGDARRRFCPPAAPESRRERSASAGWRWPARPLFNSLPDLLAKGRRRCTPRRPARRRTARRAPGSRARCLRGAGRQECTCWNG